MITNDPAVAQNSQRIDRSVDGQLIPEKRRMETKEPSTEGEEL